MACSCLFHLNCSILKPGQAKTAQSFFTNTTLFLLLDYFVNCSKLLAYVILNLSKPLTHHA